MESIDKFTLELLTNKIHYKKYLEREEPKKFKEHQEYLEKIKKHKSKILRLSNEFLENPEKMFNIEMNEMFAIYSKTIIKYIELKEIERENLYNKDDESEDEEILFDPDTLHEYESDIEESEKIQSLPILDAFSFEQTLPQKKESPLSPPQMNTFWGDTIKKMEI
jgi:hypothetical protein